VINTGKSFSVSVWAKVSQLGDPFTALSESGQYASGFRIWYVTTASEWRFSMSGADNETDQDDVTTSQQACAPSDFTCRSSRLGVWTTSPVCSTTTPM